MVFAGASIANNRIGLGDTRPMEYTFPYPVECMHHIWLSRPEALPACERQLLCLGCQKTPWMRHL